MRDVFIERMVKKKMDGKDILIIVGLFVLSFLVIAASIMFLGGGGIMLVFLVVAGVCFGLYKLITMRNLEYEYSLTNGYMTVDKIVNRASRKRITSFECNEVEDIGDYQKNAERLKNRDVESRIFASEYSDGQGSWFVIVRSQKTGKTLLVFDPDEDLQEAIKKFISPQLRFSAFGREK